MPPFLTPREKREMKSLVGDIIRSTESVCKIYRKRQSARASAYTGVVGTDRVLWRAQDIGTYGNAITVEIVSGTLLSVSVDVKALTVELSDAGTSVTELISAISDDADSRVLVEAISDDTGLVSVTQGVLSLSGGVDEDEVLYGNDDAPYSVLAASVPIEVDNKPPIDLGKNIDAVGCLLWYQDVLPEDHLESDGILYRVQTVDDNPTFGVSTHRIVQLVRMHDASG